MSYTNFTKVGSPTITDDGIASGFSSSNYINTIQISNLSGKSWTIKDSFTFGSVSGNGTILGLTPTYAVRGALYYNSTGNVIFGAYCGTTEDKTSEGAKITLTSALTAVGAVYSYELSFDYPTGKYTLSIYDSNKVLINSGEYTPPTTNKQLWDINNNPTTYISIGKVLSGTTDPANSIDLNAFKIYVDGNLVYQPYSSDFRLINRIYNRHDTAANFSTNNPILAAGEIAAETDTYKLKIGDGTTTYNSLPYVASSEIESDVAQLQNLTTDILPNYTVAGSPTIVNNVASNFSNDDYIKTSVKYNNTNQTWEFKGKMKVPTGAITRSNYYFVDIDESFSSQVDSAIFGLTTTRSFSLFLSSNGTSWDIAPMTQSSNKAVPLDTDFYVKVGFTGSKYYLKTSTNDVTYTDRISITSSTPIYNTNSYMCLGSGVKWGDGSGDGAFQGIMYIDECSFTQNGVEIWNGATSTRAAKAYSKAEANNLLDEKVTGSGISNIVKLTQAEYDVLATKDANTLYIIVASNS